MQLLRFLGFFEYFELFSLFILFIYFEVFFNVFQIMDFLDIFSCFEALSSTFGWFSHVFWIFQPRFLYILVLLCFGTIAIFIRRLHIEKKRGTPMVFYMGPLVKFWDVWSFLCLNRRAICSVTIIPTPRPISDILGWAMLRQIST